MNPDWLTQAHVELTDRPVPKMKIKYSGRFKAYNANVRYGQGWMEFKLAKRWKDVDEEIKKGIIQHLLQKVYSLKKTTFNIQLYEEFLRQASRYAEKGKSDSYLVQRFNILNDEYFAGMMDQPTLQFGRFSTTKLGSYSYGDDTVTISTALKDDQDMLDYVLYHELLHKKHQFTCEGGRTVHHSKKFRAEEKLFRIPDVEKRLETFIRAQRRKKRAIKREEATQKRKKSTLFGWLR